MSNENKISRNALCPCGSGKKYKLCCGASAVAAKRLEEAQRNPNWVPDGVTAVEDTTRGVLNHDYPKWTMKLVITEGSSAQKDADRVINGFLRPYHERFCAEAMKQLVVDYKYDVAILQNTQERDEKTPGQCPSVVLARYSEIWQVYKKKLDEFFTYFSDSDFDCEVRFDQSCGGPILTLTNAEGNMELFYMALPDRYGVDD